MVVLASINGEGRRVLIRKLVCQADEMLLRRAEGKERDEHMGVLKGEGGLSVDRKHQWEGNEEQGHGKLGTGWSKRREEEQNAREDRNTDQQKAVNGERRENRGMQRAVIEAGDGQKAGAKAGRGRTENNKEGEENSKRERTKASRR